MKKKNVLASLLLAGAMFLTACGGSASSTSAAGGVSGSFTGTAKGMGEVSVTLTLTDNVITDCTAKGDEETSGIGSVVIEQFPGEVVEGNTINLDSISGATITSNAFVEAAKAALTEAGLNPDDYMAKADKTANGETVSYDADVVVIGAGGAGMTAAMTAADAGQKVVILESQAMVGGNSARATGGMNAAKTVYQDENEFDQAAGVEKTLATAAEKYADNETITALAKTVSEQWAAYQANPTGYFDSVELMELDTMVGGKGINDPELVKTLCEGTADAIDWLDENGITLHNVSSFGGASVKRIHRPVNEEGKVVSVGAYMIPLLQENCEKRGIDIVLNTTVDTILTDANGAAVGVSGTDKDGNTVVVNAKSVILATGGFGANLDMVTQYKPELAGFMTTNAAGAQGQGIEMATAIGAGTVDMDQIQIHPTVEANTAALITEGLRGDGAILVNANGERFVDEVGTRDVVSAAEIAQPGSYSWLIVDQAMANPLNNGPYYAIKVTAGVHHTMGGVTINSATEVLKEDGTVIPGLFAAGEVTGGVHGANRLGGTAVADFVVFGRIAGESAANYASAQ
ncbi:MAG: FAD-dependent oxidoreductase [Faecalibacterium prausnitzii]|nr:FAD-dependent oxidoreductase [Faecalibacterium prausnitzii]